MKSRCFNEKNTRYAGYGGRGIIVCDEWRNDFEAFHDWAMANGYTDELTIDRIDNNGNYEPSNCRWTTVREQSNNRRSNINIDFDGATYSLKQLCELLCLPYGTIYARYNEGERGDRLLRPVGDDRRVKRGEGNTSSKITEEIARAIKRELPTCTNCRELARKYGVSKDIVYDIKRGKTWFWI